MYRSLASWWPLISAPEDYAEEARCFRQLITENARGPVRTVLELGCGGGNNASHLKKHFQLTLADLSRGMLAVSRKQNPECEHIAGDMRTLRLDRSFDAVFTHDAVVYMATLSDLRAAVTTAFAHCRPGGVALFVPDFVRETFLPGTGHGGHDGNGRSLRYLEWRWDPEASNQTYIVDYAYLLRERDNPPKVLRDRHVMGLFSRREWLQVLREAGFRSKTVELSELSLEPEGRIAFVGVAPR